MLALFAAAHGIVLVSRNHTSPSFSANGVSYSCTYRYSSFDPFRCLPSGERVVGPLPEPRDYVRLMLRI